MLKEQRKSKCTIFLRHKDFGTRATKISSFLYFYQGLDPFILKVFPWKHVFPFHCERHVCDEPDESYSQPAAQFSSLSSSNDHQSPIKYQISYYFFLQKEHNQAGSSSSESSLDIAEELSSWRGWFRSGGHQSLARTKKCQELLLHKNSYENHLCFDLCYIFAFCKFRSPGFVRRHISHWQDHLKTYIRYHDGDNDDSQLVSLMMCATW